MVIEVVVITEVVVLVVATVRVEAVGSSGSGVLYEPISKSYLRRDTFTPANDMHYIC
jgi:hypothetical protein